MSDGMTIDTESNLYIATYIRNTVYKVKPRNFFRNSGEVFLKIGFPCKHITSVVFGGSNLDILYVTRWNDQPPVAGSNFKVTGLADKGLPMTKVRV